MKTVGKFEKVSLNEFKKSIKEEFDEAFSNKQIENLYNDIKLPCRATSFSAGYDIYAPFEFILKPNCVIKIPVGIRVSISDGWFLGIVPRSGLGFKYFETLANSIGIIDSDFFNSDNEGHIMVKIVNRSPIEDVRTSMLIGEYSKYTMKVEKGKAFVQGIFLPFGITVNDDANGVRNGGFGSTDKVSK